MGYIDDDDLVSLSPAASSSHRRSSELDDQSVSFSPVVHCFNTAQNDHDKDPLVEWGCKNDARTRLGLRSYSVDLQAVPRSLNKVFSSFSPSSPPAPVCSAPASAGVPTLKAYNREHDPSFIPSTSPRLSLTLPALRRAHSSSTHASCATPARPCLKPCSSARRRATSPGSLTSDSTSSGSPERYTSAQMSTSPTTTSGTSLPGSPPTPSSCSLSGALARAPPELLASLVSTVPLRKCCDKCAKACEHPPAMTHFSASARRKLAREHTARVHRGEESSPARSHDDASHVKDVSTTDDERCSNLAAVKVDEVPVPGQLGGIEPQDDDDDEDDDAEKAEAPLNVRASPEPRGLALLVEEEEDHHLEHATSPSAAPPVAATRPPPRRAYSVDAVTAQQSTASNKAPAPAPASAPRPKRSTSDSAQLQPRKVPARRFTLGSLSSHLLTAAQTWSAASMTAGSRTF